MSEHHAARSLKQPPPARILVVDDEPLNRQLLRAIVMMDGHEVVEAEHGARALEIVAEQRVDLVLLDVMMPVLDGIETCRHIREVLCLPLLPVVLVTALGDPASRTRASEAGADEFLTKPVFKDEVRARVRNLLLLRAHYTHSETERARAQAEARRWRLVSEVARAVSTCPDYESLQRAFRKLLEHDVPISCSAFFEVVDGELRLLSASIACADPATLGSTLPVELLVPSRSQRLQALQAMRELPVFAQGGTDATHRPVLAPFGAGHAVLLPVLIGAELQGVFVTARSEPFAADDIELLNDLAPHIGNAIANVRSRLKSEDLKNARERLAQLLVHDLKNPLAVVSMNLEFIAQDAQIAGPLGEALTDARDATQRVLGMVAELLDIGRAEEGQLTIERRTNEIGPLLDDICARHRASARAAEVTLVAHSEPGLLASFDDKLVRRVIENLLSNGLRYVSAGGRVELHARTEGDRLLLCVENDGPSIPHDARERIFDKYWSGNARADYTNQGLGLYFCQLAVTGHGGTIAVTDRVGGGVCFEIRLPALVPVRSSGRASVRVHASTPP